MSEPFLGEIKMTGYGFAPSGWAKCDGQVLPIAMNQALFSLIGTTYGGNGQTSFGLPDLRGRTPIHRDITLGRQKTIGQETVVLHEGQLPAHSHTVTIGAKTGNTNNPTGALSAKPRPALYGPAEELVDFQDDGLGNVGSAKPFNNMQPYLVVNFVIALQGVYPGRHRGGGQA
ncbi:Phage tail protein [Sulfidibacter corallicola]|uniref:Phage tail protein n=1 Tax=Sulfidibacter corallicola TaxID=2818388 RepID=A0A8A4TCZ0_SULCO|nr:tail fiber protein [Sulfidibacter corallicola]QTD47959.1 phage tail protein [Sulfidibacter corallicola]